VTVLVSWTPGPVGERALDAAIAEAQLRSTRLVVVNATKGDALVDTRFDHHLEDGVVGTRLKEAGVDHEIVQEFGHDPVDVILDVLKRVDADLLVLGLRHRTPVGKLILGSTSQRLLLDSPIPVLAVKPPK
jgi:nucleotide-binding universal stress UspA family protein